jgi:hypothetical protein
MTDLLSKNQDLLAIATSLVAKNEKTAELDSLDLVAYATE